MTTEQREGERKYDTTASLQLPDLHDLPGVAAVAQPLELQLEATYFDTSDLRLANRRLTLRRRTGGSDAGWHLKMPTPDGERQELHEPLGEEDTVPDPLARLVRVYVRDGELRPVARITTRRTVHRVLGPDDRALADVADDAVTAESLVDSGTATTTWRAMEVELIDGASALLEVLGDWLVVPGAAPS